MDFRRGLTHLFAGRCGTAFRSLIRRLCGRVRIKRRLPNALGRLPLYVSPAATLEYLLPGAHCFDPELLRVAEQFVSKGDTVWDVGANLGVFTLAAAYRSDGGRVVAFEADPWLASMIRDTLHFRANRQVQASVLCGAIGASSGVSRFCIAHCGRASSFLKESQGRSTAGGVEYELEVFTMSLDDFLTYSDAPDFVKIDVEGAEVSVLHGATRLLRDVQPMLYIEVGSDAKEAATALLQAAGYVLFNVSSGQAVKVDECCINTLAVHQSKVDGVV